MDVSGAYVKQAENDISKKFNFRGGSGMTINVTCKHCGHTQETKSMEEVKCKECDGWTEAYYGNLIYLQRYGAIRNLADGPKTDIKTSGLPAEALGFIQKIKSPLTGGRDSDKPSKQRRKTVYYLPGDERAAMRLYIEMNEELVTHCLKDTKANSYKESWPDWQYDMLFEQWVWGGYAQN